MQETGGGRLLEGGVFSGAYGDWNVVSRAQ